jgi:oligopeptide transport system substrate-binding protein
MVSNENTALYMYEHRELDIVGTTISPIPTDALAKLRENNVLNISHCPGATFLSFNLERFPFTNKNIRQAFAYAINRQEIVTHLTQLGEEPATGIVPPILKNGKRDPFFKDSMIKRAQELFKKGLKELGIAQEQFPKLLYTYPSSEGNYKLAQVIQCMWAKAFGITLFLQVTENKVFLDELKNKNFDVAQCSLCAQYTDPMNILDRFRNRSNTKNYPGWEHPEFIRLLKKSDLDATPQERLATLEKAETLLIEEMPLVPLYYWKTAYMIQSHFCNQAVLPNGAFEYSRLFYQAEE